MNPLKIPTEEYIVPRFSKTERLLHWVNAIAYAALLISGFSLCFPLFNVLPIGDSKLAFFHAVFGIVLFFYIMFLYFFRINKYPIREWKRHFSFLGSNKYNAGQKVNIAATSTFFVVLLFSGLLLLLGPSLPATAVKIAFYFHNLGAFAMLFMMMGHMFLSIIHPGTNRSLMGMLIGKIESQYAKHHHREWHRDIARKQISKPDDISKDTSSDY